MRTYVRRIWYSANCGVLAFFLMFFCYIVYKKHNVSVGSPPRISFDTRVVSLGTLGPGVTKMYQLQFTNKGGNALLIHSVQSTCGCVAAALKKKTFSPGESGVIDITYIQSMGTTGTVRKTVYVHSNDPVDPVTSVTLQAHIARVIDFEPVEIVLNLRDGDYTRATVVLESRDGAPFVITGHKVARDALRVDYDHGLSSEKHIVKISPQKAVLKRWPISRGRIEFSILHPNCARAVVHYCILRSETSSKEVVPSINP